MKIKYLYTNFFDWKFILSILISILFSFYAFRNFELSKLSNIIGEISFSYINYLATTLGWNNPAVSDIKWVSSGFVLFSVSNPGVSVSGGQLTVTLILNGANSASKNIKFGVSTIFKILIIFICKSTTYLSKNYLTHS